MFSVLLYCSNHRAFQRVSSIFPCPLFLSSEYFDLVSAHVEESVVEGHDHEEDEEERDGAQGVPHVVVVVGEVGQQALRVQVPRLRRRQDGVVLCSATFINIFKLSL